MNANYRKGRALEYRTIRILEAAGFHAFRTAGSHGEFDVFAFDGLGLRLIQVKGNNYLSAVEREAFLALRVPERTSKECWRFPDRCRHPLVERL